MSGKAILILVAAFSFLFVLRGKEILDFSTSTVDNYISYYSKTNSHSIAVSGANMAASQIFINRSWKAGYKNLDFSSGKLNVTVDSFGYDNRRITSIGTYNGYKDTVIAILSPKNFAQYGNFYNSSAAWWATGDTLSGPFHINDYIQCYGNPVFLGYATTKKGVQKYNAQSKPEFLGGLETGVEIPLEFDTSQIRLAAYNNGKIFSDTTKKNKVTDVQLEFFSNGNVKYQVRIDNKAWTSPVTKPLSTLAPNGVIFIERGNLFIKGKLNGQATIVASRKGSTKAGMIHIVDDISYNKNPLTDPTSTDMLGLVAENFVQVDFDSKRGDIDIHASIYSQKDGLVIEKYDQYPGAYKMNLVGGIIGEKVRPTAKYKVIGGIPYPTNGYSYVHKFDTRFYKFVPPYFPKTKYFRVVAWYE
ncbi:MAG: hypothetical protein HXY49_01340 [Ignavibacteriaceae bacterium]|nr:hypothetical protein [Ignavibacteriaceae bacterium]